MSGEAAWYLHAQDYSASERKDILVPATARMSLEDIMLNETKRSQKGKHCTIPLTRVPGVVEFMETESRTTAARGSGPGGCRVGVSWGQGFSLTRGRVMRLDGGDGCTTL